MAAEGIHEGIADGCKHQATRLLGGQSDSRPKGRCSKHCSGGHFTLASLLCLMACRECCRQALHNPKLQSAGVRSLLSIDVLVQVIRAKVRAGQVKADSRVGVACSVGMGTLP